MALCIVILILLWWHLVLSKQINTTAQQLETLQQQLEYAKTEQFTNKNTHLELQQLWLVQIFTRLHHTKPGNSQLTQLVIKNNEVKLFGQANSMFGITQTLKSFASKHCAPTIQKITRQGDDYNFIILLACRNLKGATS